MPMKSKLKRRIVLFFALLAPLCFFSCNGRGNRSGKFQEKVAYAIREKCQRAQPCTIRIRDVTDFSWDKMYWFINTASQERVEQVLGTKVEPLKEGSKIVFMNKGKIVLFENEPWEIERRLPEDIAFDDYPDSSYFRVYGPDAEFTVKRIELNDGVAYDLNSVKQQSIHK